MRFFEYETCDITIERLIDELRSIIMNYPSGFAKTIDDVILDEINHIEALFQLNGLNPLRKVFGNCVKEPMVFC